MGLNDDNLLERLQKMFRVEAEEHLSAISSGLIAFEEATNDATKRELIETMFRAAHSLKGAARSVNYTESERLCHAVESAFAALKREELSLTPDLFDLLHSMIDALRVSVFSANSKDPNREAAASQLIRRLEEFQKMVAPKSEGRENQIKARKDDNSQESTLARPTTSVQDPSPSSDTIRVSASKLESLLTQVEELLGPKLTAIEHAKSLSAAADGLGDVCKQLRPTLSVADYDALSALEYRLKTLADSADKAQRKLAGGVDALLSDVKRALMMPFSYLFEMLPKLTRDLARSQGKDVALVINGGGIEVDRRIQDELRDALIHLIRNSVDHGIESPEERLRAGKPSRGVITVAVLERSGARVEIQIADDGKGMDRMALMEAALKGGYASKNDAGKMGEADVLNLAFQSGLSTSPIITDVSGRGLGLAIVRDRVERLGGTLRVDSRPGAGTTTFLDLPITMATFRGILVRVGDARMVVPTLAVERVTRVRRDAIQTVENRETVRVNGTAVSLTRLQDILSLPARPQETGQALIMGTAPNRMALLVDEALSEQEVIVKGFGQQLSQVPNVSGAAILGTGAVVPILNVRDALNAAARAVREPSAPARRTEEPRAQKTVLLAEDSITARTLLKGILEMAGFRVFAAVDGAEALAIARSEEIDLVVSDIEMPRMNGFGLTARIRSDAKLSELPVVLVTALESREDREKGIEVGANAYIVKSSFDQGALLEVIRRLL